MCGCTHACTCIWLYTCMHLLLTTCAVPLFQFVADIELVFDNCVAYNGDDSEYAELAVNTKKAFALYCKKHFEGEEPVEEGEGKNKKSRKKRDSRSPSACKTPELTSESSSEEEESEDDR